MFHEEGGWVAEIFGVESAFLHPDVPFEMFIEHPEGIVDLGISTN